MTKHILVVCIAIFALAWPTLSFAQDPTDNATSVEVMTVPAGDTPSYEDAAVPINELQFRESRSREEFQLKLTAMTAGLLILAVIALLLVTRGRGLSDRFSRTYLLTAIIFAGLYLVSAGYSNEQVAPVFGLLGTIAGFLFGRGTTDAPPAPVAEATVPPVQSARMQVSTEDGEA